MIENKRFKLLYSQLGNGMFVDREKQFEDIIVDKEFQKIGLIKLVDLLNKLADENRQLKTKIKTYNDVHELLKADNQQLKQSVNNLKDTIIKITIAYQRKYDRTIVDLVDEVHDEDITDLIKELKE